MGGIHVLDVTRDPDVGDGQGLVVLDVESDADLTGCRTAGWPRSATAGTSRSCASRSGTTPSFGTPVRRKRIWRCARHAVWIWALLIAVILAIVGALLAGKFDVLARLDGFPRIPIIEGDNTTTGLLAALVAAASLIGAVLGGLAGMRFHRKVDKAGLGH
ncbi:hypothetical protein [Micromonospora sp. DPT]|uniref:hypothetical protein n=1 Tax=Micromonospora sp. DPT TaxID=3142975 RepID=UPI0032095884